MCGITGWIDFERDLRGQGEVGAAMTATMACRGPDAAGLHVGEHAVLGHRRLAVIDVERGDQPMCVDARTGRRRPADQPGEDDLVIVYSGETYTFRELRAEQRADGVELVTHSDTEVVLHEHRRRGAAAVERLNGMFAYAVWDAREQSLLLVRDRLGVKPLYYHPTAHGVLFGSEPKAILAHPEVEAVVDEDGLRQVVGFVHTPGAAPYRGMREVKPGHVVRVDRDGVHEHCYWRLEAHEHTDDLDTTIDTVRELLLDTTRRQLVADVPIGTLLSGGLDSSALTAIAARELGEEPVRSFAVDFVGYTEGFQADDLRPTPDAPYVADVVAHVRSDHTDIVLDNAALLDPAARRAVLHARDLPGLGDMDTSLYLLFKAIRERSTVAVSGESADEVFGGYADFHDPAAIGSGSFPWLHGGMARMVGDRHLAPPVEKALDLDAHLAEQYDAALAEGPRLDGETGEERRMREVFHLYLTRFLPTLLDRKDRMSMAVGLEVRVPFCDHRLVQYVVDTPWSMKTFDGREKSLLRAATRDLLPPSVVDRVKSPYPATQDRGYVEGVARELLDRLDRPDSALTHLADVDALRDLARDPQPGQQGLFDRMIGIDRWVEDHDVRLEV
ncbi:asparagine synthase (glutamine-hydrolyzing) [Nocardioides litoris]|uniref:asparagine synthase (glutamine-hydrolyzing) n=1 Tax=Nocardioides litoris TaxID=1926648 RepID=UPI00111E760D|nr:asparagine synthase (glutamine-hydrolyzing) [Nocardioides litoris]